MINKNIQSISIVLMNLMSLFVNAFSQATKSHEIGRLWVTMFPVLSYVKLSVMSFPILFHFVIFSSSLLFPYVLVCFFTNVPLEFLISLEARYASVFVDTLL